MFSLEARRKRFGKRWRRKNLVRKLLKRKPVTSHSVDVDCNDVHILVLKMLTLGAGG